ncbi:uncharacterized protein LOC111467900 isoform X1 [Cucurbita maxima]|uniref:Uncharacterized protein LOC111467900 isoform X1 n=1 Tax=Cucurbita maxima TaxID=3661 RepID=A0A6J1HY40_CUCMA|nr:uncharacterized protein LOC111467900 isoform X1 [Cucurbita maxima]XP_022968756.1 uncharacterized protein LOC111467900 isoform X1 [Cucurbita maxima]
MFFTAADCDFTSNLEFHRRIPVTGDVISSAKRWDSGDGAAKRRRALKLVDRALSKRQYKSALSLVKQLQGKPYGLRAFGAAKQITKRPSAMDESELNTKDILSLQPLVDSILDSIQPCLQISAERLESLIAEGRYPSRCEEEEHLICAQHEAGHFLVGYLMGVLPKQYEVPSIQALRQNRFAEGNVSFVGFEFLGQIDSIKILVENADIKNLHERENKGRQENKGTISLTKLNQFSCVILGGLVAELLVAGNSDGHLADILKLESVLVWLGLPKSDADRHLKWAAMNTAFIMSRHSETRLILAKVMALGKSIGFCIDTIENCLQGIEI